MSDFIQPNPVSTAARDFSPLKLEYGYKYFILYGTNEDFVFSKALFRVMNFSRPGTRCNISLDFNVYELNGNLLYSYSSPTFETLQSINNDLYLELNFGVSYSLIKGRYFFGFQRRPNASCLDEIGLTGFNQGNSFDLYPTIISTYIFTYGQLDYSMPTVLPSVQQIVRGGTPVPNTYMSRGQYVAPNFLLLR